MAVKVQALRRRNDGLGHGIGLMAGRFQVFFKTYKHYPSLLKMKLFKTSQTENGETRARICMELNTNTINNDRGWCETMTKLRQPQRLQRPTIATTTNEAKEWWEQTKGNRGTSLLRRLCMWFYTALTTPCMKVFRFTRVINSWAMPPVVASWLCGPLLPNGLTQQFAHCVVSHSWHVPTRCHVLQQHATTRPLDVW